MLRFLKSHINAIIIGSVAGHIISKKIYKKIHSQQLHENTHVNVQEPNDDDYEFESDLATYHSYPSRFR